MAEIPAVEYRIVWKVHDLPISEPVDSFEQAVKLVLSRDRYEGRELADEEYDLGLIKNMGNNSYAQLWSGPGGERFAAFVALARTLAREPHGGIR